MDEQKKQTRTKQSPAAITDPPRFRFWTPMSVKPLVWSRGVVRWFRWSLSVADPSSVGASLAPPCFRFHTPLIEPDVRICRIRLSEKTHAIAEAIACDAVCNF